MINLLSYIGMNLQSELCLWTLLGLLRTIFDATLFKVNANLKQVWQMNMPPEISMPVQRVLRTMISGVMLVQCFTVYVYLASYIVLLYPVFLEERPTLVLPWLLLAAIRKFLCELTSLALGLGTCLLLGPARPPCIKFVVTKIANIMPAFYMWMLVFSYYNNLKVASAFKTFPAALQCSDHDYGLELAVRRRRTKSLQDEEQLRQKLVASFNYGGRRSSNVGETSKTRLISEVHVVCTTDSNVTEQIAKPDDIINPFAVTSDAGTYEDCFENELATVPRDTDRILEQFVLMLLRISAYITTERPDSIKLYSSTSPVRLPLNNLDCTEDTDTPPQVGSSKGRTASYLQEYPHIFMKDTLQRSGEQRFVMSNQAENDENDNVAKNHWPSMSMTIVETKALENNNLVNRKRISVSKEPNKKNIQITSGGSSSKQISTTSTHSRKVKDSKLSPMVETDGEFESHDIKSVSADNFSVCSEQLKPSEKSSHSKNSKIGNVNKSNDKILPPVDSIEKIIRTMSTLSQNITVSTNRDKNKSETKGPTTSRATTGTGGKRSLVTQDTKHNSRSRLSNTSKKSLKSEKGSLQSINSSKINSRTERKTLNNSKTKVTKE